jgi:hypothetical protein
MTVERGAMLPGEDVGGADRLPAVSIPTTKPETAGLWPAQQE